MNEACNYLLYINERLMVDEESLPAAVRSATSHRSANRPRQIGVGPLPTASFFTCYFKVVLSMMRKHHEPLLLLRFMKVQFVFDLLQDDCQPFCG